MAALDAFPLDNFLGIPTTCFMRCLQHSPGTFSQVSKRISVSRSLSTECAKVVDEKEYPQEVLENKCKKIPGVRRMDLRWYPLWVSKMCLEQVLDLAEQNPHPFPGLRSDEQKKWFSLLSTVGLSTKKKISQTLFG